MSALEYLLKSVFLGYHLRTNLLQFSTELFPMKHRHPALMILFQSEARVYLCSNVRCVPGTCCVI